MIRKILATVSIMLLCPVVAQESGQPDSGPPGSGYADMDGDVINYEYYDFGGFQLLMSEHRLKWRGDGGLFDGVVALVSPQVSRVANNIYFMSWPTQGEGGDNVVVNFDTMTVNAHLGGGDRFRLIHGVVHCRNTSDCIAPEGDVMSPDEVMRTLMANAQRTGLAGPAGTPAGGPPGAPAGGPPGGLPGTPPEAGPLSPADLAAREALRGKLLRYETDSGTTSVEVADDAIIVSEDSADETSHTTHATQIAEDVFFISWGGAHGGNHIVFNAATMKVYDQIMPDGTRKEAIYDASCFDMPAMC